MVADVLGTAHRAGNECRRRRRDRRGRTPGGSVVSAEMAPSPRSRCEQQQITRERLLRSAGELFFAKGFDTVSVDRIAAHAGYTRGAVFGNFTGKAAMG